MSDDDLDSLISQNPSAFQKQGDNVSSAPVSPAQPNTFAVPGHPKLRKIKRPKIRPAVDIPAAPAKVMPSFQDERNESSAIKQAEVSISSTQNHQDVSTSIDTEVPPIEDDTSTVASASDTDAVVTSSTEKQQGTDLIRSQDAQALAANTSNSDLSFSLDDLSNDFDYDEDDAGDEEILQEDTSYVKKNILYIAAGICFFVGLFIGKTLFATQTIENHGLEGIVANPDIPAGRPRCGLTDKSQACVFYLMNWEKQELNGRDFYKLAAYFTGREEYMIETENLRYATVKIKPGDFAQLNIPALK